MDLLVHNLGQFTNSSSNFNIGIRQLFVHLKCYIGISTILLFFNIFHLYSSSLVPVILPRVVAMYAITGLAFVFYIFKMPERLVVWDRCNLLTQLLPNIRERRCRWRAL